MPIDWIWGLLGGGLIGLGASLYLLGNGRIMGASGIIGSLVDGTARDAATERLAFLAAVVAVPAILQLSGARTVDMGLTDNWAVIVLAGLLVGLGTRIGNGCTSGHGVCGISRLSIRGIVATLVYMSAGALTIIVARHMLGVV